MPETGFEPAHPFGRHHLKVVRLPISPPAQLSQRGHAPCRPNVAIRQTANFSLAVQSPTPAPRTIAAESVDHYEEISEWASETATGDISESPVPDQHAIWKYLTISADSCLGSKCRHYNPCFVFKLKQRAEESQILIVNHHLFFADLSLQILNSISIFPAYDIVIFDEAHQLAEVATHNLSIGFSERTFGDLNQELFELSARQVLDAHLR